MPKQGTEYELFVKEVYECLNRADGLLDVDIQHDIVLTGASGVEHQIDVFWTFSKGGVAYKVAVECKDYKNRVGKDKILTFHSILRDIGNIHGIFASRMGFQSGAKEYAEKYGIQLMEIRHPVDQDWEGRMRDLHFTIHMRSLADIQPQIFVNRTRAEELGIVLPDEQRIRAFAGDLTVGFDLMTVDETVVNENGTLTIHDLISKLPRNELGEGQKYLFKFKNGILHLQGADLPVDGIAFQYGVQESSETVHILGDEVIKAIVKNITQETEMHVDRFGRVSTRKST